MKRLSFILFSVLLSTCFIFANDTEKEFPTYQQIFEFDSIPKTKIYAQIKAWIATNFNSANDVIQLDDQEKGKIILKGIYTTSYKMLGTHPIKAYNTTTFDIKDNRFRCTIQISDVIVGSGNQSAYEMLIKDPNKKAIKPVKENLDKKIEAIFESLSNLNSNSEGDDNW